jgi:drug/metabolite transporter (DMT)-like permease
MERLSSSLPTAPAASLLTATSVHNLNENTLSSLIATSLDTADTTALETPTHTLISPTLTASFLPTSSERQADDDGVALAQQQQTPSPQVGKPSSHFRGLLFVLISGILFSIMNIAVSMIARGSDPAHPLLTVVIRFSMQFILSILAIFFMRREKIHLLNTWLGARDKRLKICMRGVWGVGGLTAWFITLASMPIADATAIVYINIPLAAIFAFFVLGEAYTIADALAGLLALSGVVLVCQPTSIFGAVDKSIIVAPLSGSSVAVALAGSVCSAMAYVAARRVGPSVDTLVIVLLFAVLGCIVMPPAAAIVGAYDRTPSNRDWLLMILAGGSGFVGQLFLNAGLQQAPAGPAAVMRFIDLIISIIWQSVYIGQVPNALKLVGSVLIMSTMGSTLYKERIKLLANNINNSNMTHVGDEVGDNSTNTTDAATLAAQNEWYSRE